MFTKTHFRLLMVLLFSMFLASFACSNGEQEGQTVDAAVTSEHTEHDHAANTDNGSESSAWNKICPVCGGEVTGDLETVTYEGKVYGFGCPGCPESFSENPQDYVKNLNEDGTEFIGG